MTVKAVILAAGDSMRLYPISLEIPKPLLTLGGKTLLELTVDRMTRYIKADTIYISLGYQSQKVLQCFSATVKNKHVKYGYFLDESMPGTSYWLFRNQELFLDGDLSGDSL